MCTQKLPTPFELGYAAKPGDKNPFPVVSYEYGCWHMGAQAADEERARAEDERERENYFAWSSWEQE